MEINRKLCENVLISKLGVGAWAIGGNSYGDVAKKDAIDALEYYFEQGGNFIDTAQGYADSELVIGEFLKNSSYKNKAVIATKTISGGTMDSICDIEPTLDISLKRLGLDYVDLYYLHNPSDDDEVIAASVELMQSLKKKGKIRAVGSSVKGPDVTQYTVDLCKKYIDTGKVDTLQIVYSILRQRTENIFEHAVKNNISLVGRTSLESGFLSGKYKKGYIFPDGDHRKRWEATYNEIIDYIEQINNEFIGKADDSLTSLALRFAIEPDAITNTIVGVKNKSQMEEIISFYNKGALNKEYIKALQDMFRDKNDLFNIER